MQRSYSRPRIDLSGLNSLSIDNVGIMRSGDTAEVKSGTNALIIGLGGMGLSTVKQLQKKLSKQLLKFPTRHIAFLCIDASASDLFRSGMSEESQAEDTFLLYNDKISEMMRMREDELPDAAKSIWPPKSAHFSPDLCGEGANQIRLAGRLSIMESSVYEALMHKLHEKIRSLGDFSNRTLEIHIVAGVGGGVGGGLCIDIPYLVRRAANEHNIPNSRIKLCGHIYMPDVYDDFAQTGSSQIYRNGYAALKEIDYYMNIEQIGESFDALYPSGPFSSAKNIFDICTLIGGKSSDHRVLAGKQKAIQTCVDDLVMQITSTCGTFSASPGASLSTYSLFNNAEYVLSTVIDKGAYGFHESGNYKYTCVGTSSITFPADTVAEYVASEHLKKMTAAMLANADKAEQEDVIGFAKGLASPEDIIRPYLNAFYGMAEDILLSCLENKRTFTDNNVDLQLMAVIDRLEKDLTNDTELVNKICTAARSRASEIFRDPERGPYYLARLLTARSEEGGISGYFQLTERFADYCYNTINRLKDRRARLMGEFQSLTAAMLKPFSFRRNVDNYKQLALTFGSDELTIRLYEKLLKGLYLPADSGFGVCYELKNLFEKEFFSYADIIARIGRIAEDNAAYCRYELFDRPPHDSILSQQHHVFSALKSCVEHYINGKTDNISDADIHGLAKELTADIAGNPEKWISPSGFATAEGMRGFTDSYKPFRELKYLNLNDFLDMAYSSNASDARRTAVEYIEHYLSENGAPMFDTLPDLPLSSIKELRFSVTIIPSSLSESWSSMFKNAGGNLLSSPINNSISTYTVYLNIPIWLHRDIPEYETLYHQFKTAGIHINENLENKPPYTDYPPLMPKNQWHRASHGAIRYENKKELAYLEDLEGMIERAEKLGIIDVSESGFYEISTAEEPADEEEFELFIREYCRNTENYSNGELLGDKHIMNAMKKAWGSREYSILPARRMKPDKRENLCTLIRKQMKLTEIIRKEISIAEAVEARLEEASQSFIQTESAPSAIPERTSDPITKAGEYAFISYSTKNQAEADAMREYLKKHGVEVWMAPGDIPVGSKYARVINKAIKGCSCVVLMLTDYAQSSLWVGKEIERAVNYRKPILPVQLEDIVLNDEFELYISTDQIVAMPKVDENAAEMKQLLTSIQRLMCAKEPLSGANAT